MGLVARMNDAVGGSFVGRYFKFEERGATFTTELAGATATFLTMAYILAVNPRILADSGGPCDPGEGGIFSPEYEQCLYEINKQYVTATAIGSMVACLLMGLVADLPIALAPGMGMNAYFTYSVVGWRGTGEVSYQAAVTAVMIEGSIFFALALTGLRYKIVKMIPEPVRIATPAGIGAFLAHIGLQSSEGIGIVVSDIATAVTLGACPEEKRTPIVAYTEACAKDTEDCMFAEAYTCDVQGGAMTSGTTWLGIMGLMIIAIALAYKCKLAFVYGIGVITIISWFRGTPVTYFPDTEAGNARFDYFKKVVDIAGLDLIIAQFTTNLSGCGLALFTMLYIDFLDTSGTLLGMANSIITKRHDNEDLVGLRNEELAIEVRGIIDEEGHFPKSTHAFVVDAFSTMFGSIFGLSPITSYIESGAGVEAGARTGLCAVICGFYFFIAIFFAPILASIPPWAIGGALILVGALMARSLNKLNFNRVSHAVSGFLTVMVMPLTYSVAYGLIAGISAYLIMEGAFWVLSLAGLEIPDDDKRANTQIIGKSFVEKITEGKKKNVGGKAGDGDVVEAADDTVEEGEAGA